MSQLIDRAGVEIYGIDGLSKPFNDLSRRVGTFSKDLGQVTGGVGGLDQALSRISGGLGGFGSALTTGAGAAGVLGAALVGVVAEAVQMAAAVDQQTRRISSALGLTADQAKALKTEVAGFSVEFGRSQTEIAPLMDTVAKNGPGSVAGLRDMTRVALGLAAITGDDPTSIASGLDGVIDGFGLASESAEQLGATILGITKGRVPLGDILETLDKTAAKAHAAGLAPTEVIAAFTALRDLNEPVKQIKTDLEDLVTAGDRGTARIRELAGGARDGAKDLDAYHKALQDAAESQQRLSAQLHQQLAAELTHLGDAALPLVNGYLEKFIDNLERIRQAGPIGTIAAAVLGVPLPAVRPTPGAGLGTDPTLAAAVSGGDGVLTGDPKHDAIAKRVQAITLATKDIESVAKPRVQAFITELDALGTTPGLGKLGVEITKLTTKLSDDLSKAGSKIAAAAMRAASDLAAFVQQTATLSAKAAGDQIAGIDAQLAKLAADAKKVGELKINKAGTTTFEGPDYLQAKAALEQQRADAVVAREESERAQQTAAQSLQQAEMSSALADTRLARITASLGDLRETSVKLSALPQDQLQALTDYAATLQGIVANEHLSNEERERARRLLEEISGIQQQNGVQLVTPDVKKAHDWASALTQGARALVEALQLAGTLDGKMASIASSAITFGESLGKAIQSKGADVGADIAAIASLINIGKGLFGQSDADKEHVRNLEAADRALANLAKHAGDLATLSVSGATYGLARNVVGSIVAALAQGGKYGAPIADGTKVRNVGDVLDAAGLSAKDLESIAQTLGVTIDGTAGSYRKLAQALNAADYKAFADSWSGILADMETINQIDGVTNPVDILKNYLGALGKSGSSVIGSILAANFNVDSADGREGLRAAARSWLDQFRLGLIDPATLGNLTPQEFLDAIKTLIGDIDAVGVSADGASTGVDALTASLDTLNAALSDIALIADLTGQSAETIYKSLDKLVAAFPQYAEQIAATARGVDFTTEAGRQRFKENVANLVATFMEDGVLSPAERAILQTFLNIEHSADALGTATATAATGVDTLTGGVQTLGETVDEISQRIIAAASQATTDAKRLGKDPNQAESDSFTQNIPGLGPIDVRDPNAVTQGVAFLRKKYASGDANDKANHDIIGAAIDFFGALPAVVASAVASVSSDQSVARGFASLSETTGSTLAQFAQSDYLLQTKQLETQQSIERMISAFASIGPIVPPYVPHIAGGGGRGGAGGAGTIAGDVTLNVALNITIDAGAASAGDLTGGLSESALESILATSIRSGRGPLRRAVGDALGADYRYANLVSGNLTVKT